MITVFNMASGQEEIVPGKLREKPEAVEQAPPQHLQLRLLTIDEAIAAEQRYAGYAERRFIQPS